MKERKIIAGLGNPGKFYRDTRHNVGFKVVDRIGAENDIDFRKKRGRSLYGEGIVDSTRVMLVKPQTYMNLSGESIREIVEWFDVPLNNIIIVYDDVDIPLGTIRVRPRGSAGTHKGMRSVIYNLESDDFPRVRIGIGMPDAGRDMVSYVLGRFNAGERKIMDSVVISAAKAAVCVAVEGTEAAMSRYNGSVIGDKDEIHHRQTERD